MKEHSYAQAPNGAAIKVILQKYGQYLRGEKRTDRQTDITVEAATGEMIRIKLHARSKVKDLRKRILQQWQEPQGTMMLIWMWGQPADDDEYLLDCGCAI